MDANKWFHIVGLISACTLGIGFVTALISLGLSWKINNDQQKEIAEAKADTAKVELRVAEQQERAANAERKLLQLQERQKPRHFSVKDAAAILKGRPVGTLNILYDESVPDAYDPLGMEIFNAFDMTGWEVKMEPLRPTVQRREPPTKAIPPRIHQGVSVEGLPENCEKGDSAYCALWDALRSSGIDASFKTDLWMPKGSFRMTIGPLPLMPRTIE